MGSSPLARGLHSRRDNNVIFLGIIPARAGFTQRQRRARLARRDHPRSRGVYWDDAGLRPDGGGSSPLARGLQRPDHGAAPPRRIIPARAGFTANDPDLGPEVRDHPRSRGVYALIVTAGPITAGSSPLARGLHRVEFRDSYKKRIIPARAGFTVYHAPPVGYPADHPRSRGVYDNPAPVSGGISGSSPLARGLLHLRDERAYLLGIIPARAGFTSSHPSWPPGAPDHPRSRGVYT